MWGEASHPQQLQVGIFMAKDADHFFNVYDQLSTRYV